MVRQFFQTITDRNLKRKTGVKYTTAMSYSKLFFGKDINELTFIDIENFFSEEKEESNKIEFKSYYSVEERNHTEKENGVIRAICALLNSEGGLVIWGAPIGQFVEGKKEKIFKGELSPCEKIIEKDSFISRITDLITPSPIGILFKRLESNNKYLYIIEVDQSFYAPHQFRNIYYMRIDGQTKPAPHHYIEALFKKITFPKLEGYFKPIVFKSESNLHFLEFSYYIFNKSKLINEHDIYYRLITMPGQFLNYINGVNDDKIYEMEGHELRVLNAKPTLYYNEPIMDNVTIEIKPQDLIDSECKVDIMFFFGGKNSPLKVSEYTILLNSLTEKDLNKLLIKRDENKYIFENSDKLNISEKDSMKKILGR
jgi:hypothetical protein